jgi:hypothetical protein
MEMLAVGLAIVFCLAAGLKLASLRHFRESLRALPLISNAVGALIAAGLPLLELLTAIGLMLGGRLAPFLAVVLLLVFMAVAWYAVAQHLRVPCNCFGRGGTLSVGTIRRNAVLLCAAIPLLFRDSRPAPVNDVCATVIVALLGLCVVQLIQNRRMVLDLQK